MYIWVEWKRVRDSQDVHAQWQQCSFSVKHLCLSTSFSTFMKMLQSHLKASNYLSFSALGSLVQNHLKALKYLRFSLLLYFCESGIISRHWIILVSPHFSTFVSLIQGHFKAPNHLSFYSLLYFRESSTAQAFLSLSQPWPVWYKASTQSGITPSCPSAGFLCSPWVKIFPGLYNFPDAQTILVVTPAYTLCMDTSPV